MDFKKKTLVMIIAGVVIIAALVWKAAIPLVEEANKLGEDIKSYQEEISRFASYTNYMADLNVSYKENEEKIDAAAATIVKDSEAGKLGLLKEVEKISDGTSNMLTANILNEPNNKKGVKNAPASKNIKTDLPSLYSSFSLNLRVRGTFLTLLRMLVEMENMPYYNNIDSLSVSSMADGQLPGSTSDSTIKLKVFIRP